MAEVSEKLVNDMNEKEYIKYLSILDKIKNKKLHLSYHAMEKVNQRKISNKLVFKSIVSGTLYSHQTRWISKNDRSRGSPRLLVISNELIIVIDYNNLLIQTVMYNNKTEHNWKLFREDGIEEIYCTYEKAITKYEDTYNIVCADNLK